MLIFSAESKPLNGASGPPRVMSMSAAAPRAHMSPAVRALSLSSNHSPQRPHKTLPFPEAHHIPLRLSCWVPGLLVGLPPTALPKHGLRPCTTVDAHSPPPRGDRSRQKDKARGAFCGEGSSCVTRMGRPKTGPQHWASTSGPGVLQGRTGIQELSRALRAGARGLFRSPQPAGGGAGRQAA